jgi:hypothetical protein
MEDLMQYALLIYVDPEEGADHTDEQRAARTAEYMDLRADPRMRGGAHLKPAETATTVRVVDQQALITDGPFANTKEVFGGFYLFESDNLDAALELAQRIPAARLGGAVEVRPLVY